MDQQSDQNSYRAVREKWVHEDNLMHYRLTWLIQANGLLLTAYGVLLGVSSSSLFFGKAKRLIVAFPLLGLIVSFAIALAIYAAISAQKELHNRERIKPENERFPLNVGGGFTWMGYAPPAILPVFFLFVWVIIWAAGVPE